MDKSEGEEGEGEMNGESIMEAYTLPYVKQRANGNFMYNSGTSYWGSVTAQRSGKGWEVGSRGRGHMYTYG